MNYRPEIDGLRALAVLPVILFHAGFDTFAGGYVGVDIFFVISGYLITSIIVAEQERGTFRLISFYNRRARRILPALLFVTCVCLPFAWILLAATNFKEFAKSVRALSVFGSNFFFARDVAGYFTTAAELKPLLHTWSLTVEEQFYLMFPAFLLLASRLGRQRLGILLTAIAVASFALAQWGAIHQPLETFFLTQARAWELLTGGLLALLVSKSDCGVAFSAGSIPMPLRELVGAIGFAMIAYSVFAFDKTTPYPSFHTLVPALGTSLILVFASAPTLIARLLSVKVLVAVGLISYSAYLWHQPLFAFTRFYNNEQPGVAVLLAIVGLSFVLAALTWRFVETPFRSRKAVTRSFFVGAGSISAGLFVFGQVFAHHDRFLEPRVTAPARFTQSLAYPQLSTPCERAPVGGATNLQFCLVGDKTSATRIALFGDSHSEALLPAFDEAARASGVGVVHVTLGGCPGLLGIHLLQHNRLCPELAQRQFEYVRDGHIRKVFFVSRWTLYTDGDYHGKNIYYLGTDPGGKRDKKASRRAFLQGLEQTIAAYRNINVRIYVVAQVPQQRHLPEQVYHQLFYSHATEDRIADTVRNSAIPLDEHRRLQHFTRHAFAEYAAAGEITLIDFDSIFCDERRCPFGNRYETFYFDTDHLSTTGSALLREPIANYLRAP
jgi:peptidoglycan/LPS O-acetylase OafA/YrhL